MPGFAQLAGSTTLLVGITLVSKLIGFAREIILLETVGIGLELDIFLVLYLLSTLIIGGLGICIVTSVTPLARSYSGREGAILLMRGGLLTAILTWIAATLLSLSYSWLDPDSGHQAMLMALIVPGIVPFAVLAEYQAALFLARGRRTPVISGNIIVSLPLALALLAFDLTIIEYAIGLVLSFGMRTGIFGWLLTRCKPSLQDLPSTPPRIFGRRFLHTLAGGSAMLAITVIYITLAMAARHFGAGSTSIVSYGLKLPLLVLTSIWFVLGTGYFVSIIDENSSQIRARILRLTLFNLFLFLVTVVFVFALRSPLPGFLDWRQHSEILYVFQQSLPFTPLILLVPTIEMIQRLGALRNNHFMVAVIAIPTLLTGLGLQVLGLTLDSFDLVLASPGSAALIGFLLAIVLTSKLQTTSDADES